MWILVYENKKGKKYIDDFYHLCCSSNIFTYCTIHKGRDQSEDIIEGMRIILKHIRKKHV